MSAGIHHVTLITGNVQANVDFYSGFLGLRLVKQTAGYEDATQLHLFYGDAAGSPGSLVTFLVWEAGSRGRIGVGQPSEISLAIEPASIGFWLTRALAFGVQTGGPVQEFGEPVLRLTDPDGVKVKLVGTTTLTATVPLPSGDIPAEHAIRRIRGVILLSAVPDETEAFLAEHWGYARLTHTETVTRMISPAHDVIDIQNGRGFWAGVLGAGAIDHVAFRADTPQRILERRRGLERGGATITQLHDRKYFSSLYVREPGGVLFELATDGPGMTVDEESDALGTTLFVPPDQESRRQDIAVMLPQFARPGEDRIVYRDLPFVHRFHVPENPDGTTLVLLHGTGGNEASLMPLAARIAPAATLLGVRGRSTEEGVQRWFRRITDLTFDQDDIRAEAEAFAAFLEGAQASYGLDPARTVFLGYSNGANFIGVMMLLCPHRVKSAILLRPIPVLDDPSSADLGDARVLLVSGADDPYGAHASGLAERLREAGAAITSITVTAGHDLASSDIEVARDWLASKAL